MFPNPRYRHGQLLSRIPENEEATFGDNGHSATINFAPPTISNMPSEVLTEILFNALELDKPFPPINRGRNAFTALRLSHVSPHFRHTAINDAFLWAEVLFFNGVHPDFLGAMLERSQGAQIRVFFLFDKALALDNAIGAHIRRESHRITSLHAQMSIPPSGSWLEKLLSLPASSLENLTLHFVDTHSPTLDFLTATHRLFRAQAPALRDINLINCFIPPEHFLPMPLSRVRVHFDRPLQVSRRTQTGLSPDSLSWGVSPRFLSRLTLVNCIQASPFPGILAFHGPLFLPFLRKFVLVGSLKVCEQLLLSLRLPRNCSRSITALRFTGRNVEASPGPAEFSAVLCRYIPRDILFTHCGVELGQSSHTLRLIKSGPRRMTVTLVLDDEMPCHFPAPKSLRILPKVALALLSRCREQLSDTFFSLYWDSLSTSSKAPLSTVTTLHLSSASSTGSHVPRLLQPLGKVLINVQDIVLGCTDEIWTDPSLETILVTTKLCNVRRLVVDLDLNDGARNVCLHGLRRFVQWNTNVEFLLFRIERSHVLNMGHAASSHISCLIGAMTVDFPLSVTLDWIVI